MMYPENIISKVSLSKIPKIFSKILQNLWFKKFLIFFISFYEHCYIFARNIDERYKTMHEYWHWKYAGWKGSLLQLRDEFFHHTRRYYCHKLCLFLSLMYIIYYK